MGSTFYIDEAEVLEVSGPPREYVRCRDRFGREHDLCGIGMPRDRSVCVVGNKIGVVVSIGETGFKSVIGYESAEAARRFFETKCQGW